MGAMWVLDTEGRLVNLNHTKKIEVRYGIVFACVGEETYGIYVGKDKEDAKLFVQRLGELLSAIKCREV